MEKWLCRSCDYIYEKDSNGVEDVYGRRLNFDDLPKDWVCPDCGTPKDKFVKMQYQLVTASV